jgi:predicted Zn finger-like uncharacterized protein
MDIVCKNCRAKLRVPEKYLTGERVRVRCKGCGTPIILLGAFPDVQALGATVVQQTRRHPSSISPAEPQRNSVRPSVQSTPPVSIRPDEPVYRETEPQRNSVRPSVQSTPPVSIRPDEPVYRETEPRPSSVRPDMLSTPPISVRPSEPAYRTSDPDATHIYKGSRSETPAPLDLSDLKDLAKKRTATSAEITEKLGGVTSGEGSGFIDIRALLSLTKRNSEIPAAMETSDPEEGDLIQPQPLRRPTSMFPVTPSLAPVSQPSKKSDRSLSVAIIGGFAMLIVAAAISLGIVFRGDPTRLAAASGSPGVDTTQRQIVPSPQPVQTAPAPQPAIEKPVVEQPKAEQVPAVEPEGNKESVEKDTPIATPSENHRSNEKAIAKRAENKSRAENADKENIKEEGTEVKEEKAQETTDKKDKGYGIDDVLADGNSKDKKEKAGEMPSNPYEQKDSNPPLTAKTENKAPQRDLSVNELMDEAVTGGPKKAKPVSAPQVSAPQTTGAIPETPTRQQVVKAMRDITPAARHCTIGTNVAGVVNLTVVVQGSSGQVTSAQANGVQEPVSSCIIQEVKKAKFPAFSKAELSFNYPLKI